LIASMNSTDTDSAAFDMAARLFRSVFDRPAAERGETFSATAWMALEEAGLPLAMAPEAVGGAGMSAESAADLLRLVGYWAAPTPLAEAMLSAALLMRAGIPIPEGVRTFAPPARTRVRIVRQGAGWTISGLAQRVPWARDAAAIVLAADGDGGALIASLPAQACSITHGVNLAGEPRDDVAIDMRLPPDSVGRLEGLTVDTLRAAGAGSRAIMLAGAAQRVLDKSLAYAREHEQFGRPIAAFQAVQQNLAVMAGQAAICRAAGDMAAESLFDPLKIASIAMAKACAGEAASRAAQLAHQVHGAMGFTAEYDLHLYTKRIWSWREEYGAEAEWAVVVGRKAADEGAWRLITALAEPS